jgi:hypothetical protein
LIFKDIKEIRSAVQEEKGSSKAPFRNLEEVGYLPIYARMLYYSS